MDILETIYNLIIEAHNYGFYISSCTQSDVEIEDNEIKILGDRNGINLYYKDGKNIMCIVIDRR